MDDDRRKPPPVDDPEFLDSLMELDRGLRARDSALLDTRLLELDHGLDARDPVDSSSPGSSNTTPTYAQRVEDSISSEQPIRRGSLAARRRPWRASIATAYAAPSPFPPPPAVGQRAQGPSIGGAQAPSLPRSRPTRLPPTASPDLTYEVFYGFDEKPFSLSSDPKLIYRSASFDGAMQDLVDAIDRHDGVMLLTGPKGVGKTTLCLSLVGQVADSSRASFLTDPPLTDELLDSLQQSSVVVVDDAHRWPVKMLEQLCRLADGTRDTRPQVVLVGEPIFLTSLRRRALRQLNRRVRTRCQLEPLTADEVAAYVAHRIAMAGAGVRVEFDDGAIAELHAISGGLPRLVNLICDGALAKGHRQLASRIDATLIASAADDLNLIIRTSAVRSIFQWAAIVVALIALFVVGAAAAAWVFRDDIHRAVVEENRATVPGRR